MTLESRLVGLSPSEKLDAFNILWRELTVAPATFASPAWHADVLKE
ncbi:MAG: hypothetical protein QM811_07880 [Pirellulales bacterium]